MDGSITKFVYYDIMPCISTAIFSKIFLRHSNILIIKDFRTNKVLSSFHTQNSCKMGKYRFTNSFNHAWGVCLFTLFHSQVI